MSRSKLRSRNKQIYEWVKGRIDNIGVITPLPYDIIFNHIKDKNLYNILQLFFDNSTKKVDLLDQCVLEQFWWTDNSITSARYSKADHPSHYSGEYVFDKNNNERTIIEIRQPDIDGKHWRTDHIHILRGSVDPDNPLKILMPNFNEHVELSSSVINGVYMMRIP